MATRRSLRPSATPPPPRVASPTSFTATPLLVAPSPTPPPPPTPDHTRRSTLLAAGCMVAALGVLLFGLTLAAPLVTSGWNVPALIALVVILVALDQVFRSVRPRASRRALRYVFLGCVVVCVLYGLGVVESSVVNGHVDLATSPTAHAADTITAVDADVHELFANEYLLSLSPARAKADFALLAPAIATATTINTTCFATHANPSLFKGVYVALGNAAYWQEKALTNVENNLTESGVSTNAAEKTDVATFLADVHQAEALLSADAATYGLRVPSTYVG